MLTKTQVLDNGATMTKAQVVSININPVTKRVSGVVVAYTDADHLESGKGLKNFPVNSIVTDSQLISNPVALIEDLAMENYPELEGATQS
jgi:hypothetical protein